MFFLKIMNPERGEPSHDWVGSLVNSERKDGIENRYVISYVYGMTSGDGPMIFPTHQGPGHRRLKQNDHYLHGLLVHGPLIVDDTLLKLHIGDARLKIPEEKKRHTVLD